MDLNALGWIAVVVLLLIGVAGTLLPALPGVAFVLGGIVLGAWLDDFARVPVWIVVLCAVLAVLAWATDYLATILGAKKAGASTLALVGAALGMVAGLFMGFVGVLFMPFVGAVLGEWLAEGKQAGPSRWGLRPGSASW